LEWVSVVVVLTGLGTVVLSVVVVVLTGAGAVVSWVVVVELFAGSTFFSFTVVHAQSDKRTAAVRHEMVRCFMSMIVFELQLYGTKIRHRLVKSYGV
jgi:hypothetical protein